MIGSVFITGTRHPSARLLRHEAKHANQWALFGPINYPALYGIDEYLLSKGGGCNHFETQAGRKDGGYKC
jgi:hypothetical protein